MLFVPDPSLSFDFDDPMARMPTKQVALTSRPDVKRLIEVEAQERAIKIKYPVSSGQLVVTGIDAVNIKRLAMEKQTLMLRVILAMLDHASPCPCNSGKKFRKCHRGDIERMVRLG